MINFAKFEIIGRIGEIDARPKVTLLSVCANYRRKGDDDEWQEDSHWNRVSVFSEVQRKHLASLSAVSSPMSQTDAGSADDGTPNGPGFPQFPQAWSFRRLPRARPSRARP